MAGGGGGGTPPNIKNRYTSKFKILTNRFPFLFGGEKINNLMAAIRDELLAFQDKLNEVDNSRFLLGSTGFTLDLWGQTLGLARQPNENDNTYRARLLVVLRDIKKTLSIRAYKDAIKAVTNTDPQCLEHYKLLSSFPFLWSSPLLSQDHILQASFIITNHNYIQNPGFESGTWGGAEEQTTEEKFKGQYSAKLVADGTQQGVISGSSNYIRVNPEQYTYTVSCYHKITQYSAGLLVFQIQFYDEQQNLLGSKEWAQVNQITDWQRLSYTLQALDYPPGTTQLRCRFYWWEWQSQNPIGTAYIDNYKTEISQNPTEDYEPEEYEAMAETLQSVKLATLTVHLLEDSGPNYYIIKKII